MEHTKLALSAVMIVAVGLVGTNFVTGLEMTPDDEMNAFVRSSPVYGHVTVIHSDPSGQIMSYSQGDNIVTHEGKDCSVEGLFKGTGGMQGCPATGAFDNFDFIGLTNGQTFEVTANATSGCPTFCLNDADLSTADLLPQVAVVTSDTNATGTAGSIVDIAKTFTRTINAGQSVDGAILYNSANTVAFAAQTFASVTLNLDDTLAVTWTITFGGA